MELNTMQSADTSLTIAEGKEKEGAVIKEPQDGCVTEIPNKDFNEHPSNDPVDDIVEKYDQTDENKTGCNDQRLPPLVANLVADYKQSEIQPNYQIDTSEQRALLETNTCPEDSETPEYDRKCPSEENESEKSKSSPVSIIDEGSEIDSDDNYQSTDSPNSSCQECLNSDNDCSDSPISTSEESMDMNTELPACEGKKHLDSSDSEEKETPSDSEVEMNTCSSRAVYYDYYVKTSELSKIEGHHVPSQFCTSADNTNLGTTATGKTGSLSHSEHQLNTRPSRIVYDYYKRLSKQDPNLEVEGRHVFSQFCTSADNTNLGTAATEKTGSPSHSEHQLNTRPSRKVYDYYKRLSTQDPNLEVEGHHVFSQFCTSADNTNLVTAATEKTGSLSHSEHQLNTNLEMEGRRVFSQASRDLSDESDDVDVEQLAYTGTVAKKAKKSKKAKKKDTTSNSKKTRANFN